MNDLGEHMDSCNKYLLTASCESGVVLALEIQQLKYLSTVPVFLSRGVTFSQLNLSILRLFELEIKNKFIFVILRPHLAVLTGQTFQHDWGGWLLLVMFGGLCYLDSFTLQHRSSPLNNLSTQIFFVLFACFCFV